MKRLSLYLFLIFFTFPTPSQADDIRDFQIEGMSIGDSLLDYFSKDEIKKFQSDKTKTTVKDFTFWRSNFRTKPGSIYENIRIYYKTNDPTYTMYMIQGGIALPNEKNVCLNKIREVEKEIKTLFKNTVNKNPKDGEVRYTGKIGKKIKHSQDKSGKSFFRTLQFGFNFEKDKAKYSDNIDRIDLKCYLWHKDFRNYHAFMVQIAKAEYFEWILNKAFK